MNLELHEVKSPLWAKLKEHMNNELTILRERNDQDLDPIKTAHIRGKAAMVKAFLLLETPAEPEPNHIE